MKYLITICLVGAMLTGSVYADNTQTTIQSANVEGYQNTTVQGPGYSESSAQGGDAAAGAYSGIYWDWNYSPTSIMRYPEYRVPPVNPGQAPLPWPYPPSPWFWNSWPNGLTSLFQREWKLNEVEGSLHRIYCRGPVECLENILAGSTPVHGKGFKWQICLNDYEPRPDNKLKFITLTQDVNMPALQKEYIWLGSINVMAKENLTIDQTVRCAVRLAFKYNLDLGILVMGMNPVNNAVGVSPGVGWNTAGVNNNFALITSLSGGKAVVRAEPGATMFVFRKNETAKLPVSEQILPTTTKAKEKKPPGVEVSEEAWQKAKEIRN